MSNSETLARDYALRVATRISEEYETDEFDVMEFLSDALDVNYIFTRQGHYRGAEIVITVGGPHAEIDTRRGVLSVSWNCAPVDYSLPGGLLEELDDCLAEFAAAVIVP